MLAELEDAIRDAMERERIPGLAIALVRGDEVVHAAGYGLAERAFATPVTAETVFGAASITKSVLATALMRHHEAGRFALDDPVDLYLAPIRFENAFGVPVTARHLLTHTAGLPVGNAPAAPEAKTLAEHVVASAKAEWEPGTRIVYANWGYDMLGYLLGLIAGRPWPAEVQECLFKPLAMSSRVDTAPEARGYYRSVIDGEYHEVPQAPSEVEPPLAAGSMVASASDLARFLTVHTTGGGGLLRPETIADMHRLHARSGDTPGGMGLGFRVDSLDGRPLICHGGDGMGTTNLIAALPAEGVGMVLLTNLQGAQQARSTLGTTALRLLSSAPAATRRRTAHAPTEDRTGHYASTFWDVEVDLVAAEDDDLDLCVRRGAIIKEPEVHSRLEPLAPNVYRARGGMFDGLELRFHARAASQPQRFSGGIYPFEFERTGVAEPLGPPEIDATLALAGTWQGTTRSPLGPLPVKLEIADAETARVDTLTVQGEPITDFCAARGRVEGAFSLEVPQVGRFEIFLRLVAAKGELVGPLYARGEFGEFAMETRLTPT